MRTSEIQAQILAQLGITVDDYYCDPNLSSARNIFCRVANCGPTDEEVAAFLHAQKPACNRGVLKQQLEEEQQQLELEKKKAEKSIVAKAKELENIKEKESIAYKNWIYGPDKAIQELESRLKTAKAALEALKAASKRPPAKQVAALEEEIATHEQTIKEQQEEQNRLQKLYFELSNAKKDCAKQLKDLKNKPNMLYYQENSVNNILTLVLKHDDTYYKQDEKALDFIFALLLRVELEERTFDRKEATPVRPLTGLEHLKVLARSMRKNNLVLKDWRQQLYRICSTPLRRLAGIVSYPTEENAGFFNYKRMDLSATDLAAFLSLKMAALHNEYVVTGNGTIVLAMPGGLAAKIKFRAKGKVVAKQQKQPVEVFVNCLQLKQQYAYHLMYHYDGGPAEGVGIETPGAYYILSENYVLEIAFMASPMLLGFENMARTAQGISIVARLDEEQARQEEFSWGDGDWEED